MPFVMRLREAGFRVWPFESSLVGGERPQPLLVEMYTRLLTGAVAKSNPAARKAYLAGEAEGGCGVCWAVARGDGEGAGE